jgi:hypothetical protein
VNPAHLIATAREQTGLADFGGEEMHEGLGVFCESLDADAQLSELGVMALEAQLVANLTNRLKTVDWVTTHPEVSDEAIVAPVVVIGLFRAGTTLLSNLLDQDPGNRTLLTWESADTAPPAGPDTQRSGERVEANRFGQQMLDAINPVFKTIHHEDPEGPTECISLLCEDYKALLWESVANVAGYGEWLMTVDHTSAYRHHKRSLQVLQSGGVRGRWTLKSPHHALALDAVTAVYPDARLVYLHRDPVEVAASAYSLISCLSGTFSDADHTAYIARRWTEILVACTERVDAFRDSHPGVPILDLSYRALIADPMATMEQLYGFLGEPLTAAEPMRAYLAAHPKGEFGAHRYDVADYGVSAGALRERFAGYLDRYELSS